MSDKIKETARVSDNLNGLVSCPCGGAAEIKSSTETNHRGPAMTVYYAACTACSFEIAVRSPSRERAVAIWNSLRN